MNEYIVTRKSDGAEVARYTADLPAPEDLANTDYDVAEISVAFSAPPDPDAPPDTRYGGRRMISKLEFIALLGDAAYIAILTIAKQSVEIEAWIKMIELTSVEPNTGWAINLDDPRTAAGIHAIGSVLTSNGVVTAGWAEGVLRG